MSEKKEPLVILTGPTGVGKSALSIRLAQEINGEIISADSMQVYKGMDIGTAKIKPEEMEGIKHYLIDILEPFQDFNVFAFRNAALEAVNEIRAKGKIPIIVGGTGFYIQALLYDISFEAEDEDHDLREALQKEAQEKGNAFLFEKLRDVDPESCRIIHPNNVKRVIRALEFFQMNGYPISTHNEQQHCKESPFDFCYFVLTDNRDTLYENINRRVDIMKNQGLLEEIKRLQNQGLSKDNISMEGIGYKELISVNLEDVGAVDTSLEQIKQNTRHFAKRQLTWFKREKEVIWLDKEKLSAKDSIMNEILIQLKAKKII